VKNYVIAAGTMLVVLACHENHADRRVEVRGVTAAAASNSGTSGAEVMKEQPAQRPTGNATSAAQVIGEMRSDFRTCYNAALAAEPGMTGCARLTILVGSDGRVQRVAATSTGLSDSVVSCIRARASRSVFDPPAGGHATINFPIGLAPKDLPDSVKRDRMARCESQTPMPDTNSP
jgi:hypothetical protein